uniref:Superoxide dismutase [Cu-Zn] n=1 Tax=Angiostrongylus cantonensis TaxID=6313 RepID=A0A0K0DPA0_ANGCA
MFAAEPAVEILLEAIKKIGQEQVRGVARLVKLVEPHNYPIPRAVALIFQAVPGSNPTNVIGTLSLTENNGMVTISGSVNGLPPGPHAIHVHEFGDLSNGCLATGAHYNPFRSDHGSQENPPSARHVGDLGNIVTPVRFLNFVQHRFCAIIDVLQITFKPSGPTPINIEDSLITFTGRRGIVGRAFVIHERVDDLGRGGDAGSRTVGNAGARLACGVIGYVAPGTA